jgi:alkylation response protein AidB-like acyl-CoA dehydrogenase
MHFDLTAEQTRLRDAARALAASHLAAEACAVDAIDASARWPEDHAARVRALGVLDLAVGHDALDVVGLALAIEELSAACPSTGAIVAAHALAFGHALATFGNDAQKREAGRGLGALAWAEGAHDAGGPLRTAIVKRGDGDFTLDGDKRFVILAPDATHLLVFARGPALGQAQDEAKRETAALVRRDARGVSFADPDARLGARAARSCSVRFDGVRVTADDLVGAVGDGERVLALAQVAERVGVAAHAVGVARGAWESAVGHVKARKADGPRIELQSTEFAIADMALAIDAARLLVLRAARALDVGTLDVGASRLAPLGADPAGAAAIAKLFASEAAARVTHAAALVFGREGATAAASVVDRAGRAARMTEIDGGASDLVRAQVAALEA